jgi:hypothetical protein
LLLKCANTINLIGIVGGCLYINFKRLKSAACQEASLFHDLDNFATCPVHASAVAIAMQSSPSEFLLDHLPRDTQEVQQQEQQPFHSWSFLMAGCRIPTAMLQQTPAIVQLHEPLACRVFMLTSIAFCKSGPKLAAHKIQVSQKD